MKGGLLLFCSVEPTVQVGSARGAARSPEGLPRASAADWPLPAQRRGTGDGARHQRRRPGKEERHDDDAGPATAPPATVTVAKRLHVGVAHNGPQRNDTSHHLMPSLMSDLTRMGPAPRQVRNQSSQRGERGTTRLCRRGDACCNLPSERGSLPGLARRAALRLQLRLGLIDGAAASTREVTLSESGAARTTT